MKQLNQFRLLAGIEIDPKIEITEKEQITETAVLTEAASDAALNDFWCVCKADKPNMQLNDVLTRTNTQGLVHMILGAAQRDPNFEDDFLIFAGSDKAAATKEAKKRIRLADKAAKEEEEEMFFQKAEQEYEEDCEYEEATKLADKDYDGDGKIESPEAEFKGSRSKAINKAIRRANQHEEEEVKESEDFEPKTNICPDCMEQGGPPDPDCERCGGEGEIFESMHTFKVQNYDSWEDDEEEATNVAGDAKKVKAIPDEEQVKAGKNDPKTTDAPEGDKDESPTQLKALDTPSQQDQSGGGDLDRKVTVPANIKSALKSQADEARREAKKLNVSNREASYFYDDLAQAFDDLRGHLEGGTVYDLKQAQIFMTSLMGPMLHKIPAEVVKFIANGGKSRSLKDYMTKVDAKYPITGPRNSIS